MFITLTPGRKNRAVVAVALGRSLTTRRYMLGLVVVAAVDVAVVGGVVEMPCVQNSRAERCCVLKLVCKVVIGQKSLVVLLVRDTLV